MKRPTYKKMAQRIVKACDGNMAAAARALSTPHITVSRQTLHQIIKGTIDAPKGYVAHDIATLYAALKAEDEGR